MTVPANVTVTSYGDGRTLYHLGTLFDGAAAVNIGAYQVGSVSVPSQWWGANWTDRTQPITVKRTAAQLVAANRMFPFGDTGCIVKPQPVRVPYTVMGASNVTIYMPTTGERPDLGWVTDNSGYFMLGGSPLPMIDWALANDSCPLHFRDETTGKPISLVTYPQANAADQPGLQGAPYLVKGPKGASGYYQYGGGWTVDQAHFPEMSYVAHIATLDGGFLENLQYNANFGLLCDAVLSNPSHGYPVPVVSSGQMRGEAWAFRNLFMAHAATQDAEARGDLPTTCHPSSYFKQLLDNSLAYYSKIAAKPENQRFRLLANFGRFPPWQADYMTTVLAFGVLTGHGDWAPLYLWALGNVIARTNNLSGYPPGLGTAYQLNCYPGGDTAKPQYTWSQAFDALVGDPEAGITQAQHDQLVANPLNGGKAMVGLEYMMTTRAALVMADHLDKRGLAGVRQNYPEFDTALANAQTMFLAHGVVNPRVAVISGGAPMGKPFSVQIGGSVVLPITWDAGGQAAQKPTSIAVTASPPGLVTLSLAADSSNVTVVGVASGSVTLTVAGQGATAVSDTSVGTVTAVQLPLATAIHINP